MEWSSKPIQTRYVLCVVLNTYYIVSETQLHVQSHCKHRLVGCVNHNSHCRYLGLGMSYVYSVVCSSICSKQELFLLPPAPVARRSKGC